MSKIIVDMGANSFPKKNAIVNYYVSQIEQPEPTYEELQIFKNDLLNNTIKVIENDILKKLCPL